MDCNRKRLAPKEREELSLTMQELIHGYGVETAEELAKATGFNPLRFSQFMKPGSRMALKDEELFAIKHLNTHAEDLCELPPNEIQEKIREEMMRQLEEEREREREKEKEEVNDFLTPKMRDKREFMIIRSRKIMRDLNKLRVAGYPLRQPQKLAAQGFYHWLMENRDERHLRGHLVSPMGSGKTFAAVILAHMAGGRSLFLSYNNTLAEQAVDSYQAHQQTLPEDMQKTVGRCFSKYSELDADIVVSNFRNSEKLDQELDWDSINTIFVDEADVVGLSDKRHEIVKKISHDHGIPIIGLSATEVQSSGKCLQDVYPTEILRMLIPESLPALIDLELVPETEFHDLYLECDMEVDFQLMRVTGDVGPKAISEMVETSEWNNQILDHYLEKHQGKSALVVFRNNKMVDDFVESATERGLKAHAFTGRESHETIEQVKQDYRDGKYDILVGSCMLGRGLDLPEAEVIYNSMITYSPQRFWQASGRALRVDPNNPDKKAEIISVLPRMIFDERTGKEISLKRYPLSHSTFFDPEYLARVSKMIDYREDGLKSQEESIKLADVNFVRSNEEVADFVKKGMEKIPGFIGKPRIFSMILDEFTKVDYGLIRFMMVFPSFKLDKLFMYLSGHDLRTYSIGRFDTDKEMSKNEEREWLAEYFAGKTSSDPELKKKSEEAYQKLLDAHMCLIEMMAKKLSNSFIDREDLIQEGYLVFDKAMHDFNSNSHVRFATYFLPRLFNHLSKCLDTGLNSGVSLTKEFRTAKHTLERFAFFKRKTDLMEKNGISVDAIREWFYREDIEVFAHRLMELFDEIDDPKLKKELGLGKNILERLIKGWSFERKRKDLENLPIEQENPEQLYFKEMFRERILKLLQKQAPRFEYMVRHNFGGWLNPGHPEPRNYVEIAEDFELSRARVQQIVRTGLSKLQPNKWLRAEYDVDFEEFCLDNYNRSYNYYFWLDQNRKARGLQYHSMGEIFEIMKAKVDVERDFEISTSDFYTGLFRLLGVECKEVFRDGPLGKRDQSQVSGWEIFMKIYRLIDQKQLFRIDGSLVTLHDLEVAYDAFGEVLKGVEAPDQYKQSLSNKVTEVWGRDVHCGPKSWYRLNGETVKNQILEFLDSNPEAEDFHLWALLGLKNQDFLHEGFDEGKRVDLFLEKVRAKSLLRPNGERIRNVDVSFAIAEAKRIYKNRESEGKKAHGPAGVDALILRRARMKWGIEDDGRKNK